MERMKSIWQIGDQVNRICSHCRWRNGNNHDFEKYTNDPYYKKAMEISERYYKNIQATKEWKDAFRKAYDFRFYDITEMHIREDVRDSQAKTAGYGCADNLKFPKSVYAA